MKVRTFQGAFIMINFNFFHSCDLINESSHEMREDVLITISKNTKLSGIIGSCQVYSFETENDLLITNLFISESYQKKGYGRLLITEILKYCKKFNKKKISIIGHSHKKYLINFYKSFGFKLDTEDSVLTWMKMDL